MDLNVSGTHLWKKGDLQNNMEYNVDFDYAVLRSIYVSGVSIEEML